MASNKHETGSAESRRPNAEPHGSLKRRDMLKAIAVVPAAALVPLAPSQATTPARPSPSPSTAGQASGAYRRKVLNDHEWRTIRLLSDLIIPADEQSGSASDAGVPEFIDGWLDFRRDRLLTQIRGGLTWLDMECNRLFGHDFVDCSTAQQKQTLDRIAYPKTAVPEDSHAVAFFNELRNLVVSGFFSSKMGVQDLPYLWNTMVAEWKGCPPEVLAKLGLNREGGKS